MPEPDVPHFNMKFPPEDDLKVQLEVCREHKRRRRERGVFFKDFSRE